MSDQPIVSMEQMERVKINGVMLTLTCGACPEQYDAHIGGEPAGYLRLRHGHFRTHYPNNAGEVVYSADTRGDGMFDCEERYEHLQAACKALFRRHTGGDL